MYQKVYVSSRQKLYVKLGFAECLPRAQEV